MIAYSNYSGDARIRREAEVLASTEEYEVTVLTLKNSRVKNSRMNGGVLLRELGTSKYRGSSLFRYLLSYLKFMFEAFRVCNRMLWKRKVWAFHVHNIPNFLIFSALGARITGRRVILDIHDSVPETYSAKFTNTPGGFLFKLLCLEEAFCCKLADRVICVNHPQRDALVRRGIDPGKIAVSMNVPDPRIFSALPGGGSNGSGTGRFRLVYHGTLAKRLGIDLAIRAVAKLADAIPGIEFHVLGDGDDKRDFVELAKDLGVDRVVHFREAVPLEELRGILGGMDLGVVSNRRNMATELMLPAKLMEYVALGIPVVAPRLRTIEHYFASDMVGYFEPGDVDSMAGAVLALYRDPARREVHVQRARAFLDEYGWAKHQQGLLDLYRRLYV